MLQQHKLFWFLTLARTEALLRHALAEQGDTIPTIPTIPTAPRLSLRFACQSHGRKSMRVPWRFRHAKLGVWVPDDDEAPREVFPRLLTEPNSLIAGTVDVM